MKKAIFTLTFAAATLFVLGNHAKSELHLKMEDHHTFRVVLDGHHRTFNGKHIDFLNLNPGRHKIKIIKKHNAWWGHHNYSEVVYNGFVDIPPAAKVYATIDHHNRLNIYKTNRIYSNHHYDDHHHGNHHDYEVYHEPEFPVCINAGAFSQLKMTMMNHPFDKDRLKIAKQAVASNGVTSAQVLELMNCMTFESTKLKLAKFAHQYTIDQENYYVVNNGFTFSSSTDKLNEFLGWN